MKLVFVIPLLNERETLETLAEGIHRRAAGHEFRIVFVDDGSTDGSWEMLTQLREKYPAIDLIRFRRNYGKSQALAAGIARADGDVLITMDADLQDDPAEIPRFLTKLEEGHDMVCGWKAERHDPWHKTLPSRLYNGTVSWLFSLPLHDVNCGFKAMRMEVARQLPLYGDMHRMMAVHAADLGYRVTEIPVAHHPRRYGKSKYGLRRFATGALDVFTTWFLLRHSASPNHVFGRTGCAATFVGVVVLFAGLIAGLVLPFRLWDAAMPVQLLATALLFLWIVFGMLILAWGSLAFMSGLLGEMLVRRLPPEKPDHFIDPERRV